MSLSRFFRFLPLVLLPALAIPQPASAGLERQPTLDERVTALELYVTDSPGEAPKTHRQMAMNGWTVHLNEALVREHRQEVITALALLGKQLAEINKLVPAPALEHLHKVPLWINPPYPGQGSPRAEYHPNAGWLREHGRDPVMGKAVEFTNVAIYERECRRMPMFVLHELAHAYHDQVLKFENAEIVAAYEKAKASGKYDEVDQWTGTKTVKARAYALTDAKEYFAETTEAFFGRNDFQPFNREELKTIDPGMEALLAKVWGVK